MQAILFVVCLTEAGYGCIIRPHVMLYTCDCASGRDRLLLKAPCKGLFVRSHRNIFKFWMGVMPIFHFYSVHWRSDDEQAGTVAGHIDAGDRSVRL